MMAYYKANYPRPPYQEIPDADVIRIGAPVLQIHGLDDQYLLPGALNDTWKWLDADYSLVTLPGVSHFVQQEASQAVTEAILAWLER
jgi:pimeloyl-ACP methyl ester carboxylesterase